MWKKNLFIEEMFFTRTMIEAPHEYCEQLATFSQAWCQFVGIRQRRDAAFLLRDSR